MIWRFIDWLESLACHFGHHDMSEWVENTNPDRVMWDWFRDCNRCHYSEHLNIGENPPGRRHSTPSKWSW